jgi:hypothetical protein
MRKSDWRSLAKSSQTCTSLRRTGQCLVPRLARSANWPLPGKTQGVTTIIHRTVRCASRAPSQGSIVRSAGDTWLSQRSGGGTRLSGVPRGPWLATVDFVRKGRKARTVHYPVVHQTVRCAHGQKTTRAFQMELKRS